MGICGSTNDKVMDDAIEKHLSKTLTRLNVGKPEVTVFRGLREALRVCRRSEGWTGAEVACWCCGYVYWCA